MANFCVAVLILIIVIFLLRAKDQVGRSVIEGNSTLFSLSLGLTDSSDSFIELSPLLFVEGLENKAEPNFRFTSRELSPNEANELGEHFWERFEDVRLHREAASPLFERATFNGFV